MGLLYGLLVLLGWLWIFWGFYVLVMGIYRAYLSNKLSKFLIFLSFPFVLIGLIIDVVSNFTIATLVFWELPHEWLVTSRLVRYQATLEVGDWRRKQADQICTHLLDVFDPNGVHCLDSSK